MLFALVLDEDDRAILTSEPSGCTMAVIEAATWREARSQVYQLRALDSYEYRSGHGWYARRD